MNQEMLNELHDKFDQPDRKGLINDSLCLIFILFSRIVRLNIKMLTLLLYF